MEKINKRRFIIVVTLLGLIAALLFAIWITLICGFVREDAKQDGTDGMPVTSDTVECEDTGVDTEPQSSDTEDDTQSPFLDGYEFYDDIIEEYRSALALGIEAFEREYEDSDMNTLMLRRAIIYKFPLYYAIYDLDKNGTPELVFGDGYTVVDIYSAKDGKPCQLFEHPLFGERSRLHILSDGRLYNEGGNAASSSSYDLYRFDDDGNAVCLVEKCYYDGYSGRSDFFDDLGYECLTQDEYFKRHDAYMKSSVFDSLEWTEIK